jgi:hypothetical protein
MDTRLANNVADNDRELTVVIGDAGAGGRAEDGGQCLRQGRLLESGD